MSFSVKRYDRGTVTELWDGSGEMSISIIRLSIIRLLKNTPLQRFPHPSSLRRTPRYASFLRISGALHLGFFEQPGKH